MSLLHRHFAWFAAVVHKPQWVMRSTSFSSYNSSQTDGFELVLSAPHFRLSPSSLSGTALLSLVIALGLEKSSNTITQLPDPWSTVQSCARRKRDKESQAATRDYRKGDFPNEHCRRFNYFSLSCLPFFF